MKRSKIILSLLALLLLGTISYAGYLNVFSRVAVEDKEEGGYVVVGLEFTGSYSKAGQFMTEVDKKLGEFNIAGTKGFGIYYDDPKTTPKEKCRSFIGSILAETDFDKIEKLKSAGFKVDSIPRANSVVADFPIKSTLSYMIGPMKVYPVISKFIVDNGYESSLALEVYDIPNEKITFVMQYAKK